MTPFFEELPLPVRNALLWKMDFPMNVEESKANIIHHLLHEAGDDETQRFIIQNFCKAFSDEQLVELLYALEEDMKKDLATIQYLIRNTNGEGA